MRANGKWGALELPHQIQRCKSLRDINQAKALAIASVMLYVGWP